MHFISAVHMIAPKGIIIILLIRNIYFETNRLKAGAQHSSPNTAGDKLTPLHICARKGRLLSMKRLLEAGANPNCVSEQGFTPIMGIFLNYSNGRLDSFNLSGLSNEVKRSMIQLLSNAGANVRSAYFLLHQSIKF